MPDFKILSGEEAAAALHSEGDKPLLELTHNLVGGFADDYRKLMGYAPEAEIDWEPCVNRYLSSVDAMAAAGNMYIAVQNDKPVGMQGYKFVNTDPITGRQVYELSHGSILEEAEGQGYLKALVSRTLEDIRKKHGGADVIFGSANHAFAAKLAAGFGFRPLSMERLYQIEHGKTDISEFAEEIEKKRGGSSFYLLSGNTEAAD